MSRRGKLRLTNPRYTLPTAQDLIYLEESPNYCVKNESLVDIYFSYFTIDEVRIFSMYKSI